MDPASILGLISDLYAQIAHLTERNAVLEREHNAHPEKQAAQDVTK